MTNKDNIMEQVQGEFHVNYDESEPTAHVKESFNTSIASLGCSPIKSEYARRKLSEVAERNLGTISKVLEISKDGFDSQTVSCSRCVNLDQLIQNLKVKVRSSTNNEKDQTFSTCSL